MIIKNTRYFSKILDIKYNKKNVHSNSELEANLIHETPMYIILQK